MLNQLGSGLVETLDQLRNRGYLRSLYAHGIMLTVESMDQLSSVPAGLAKKATALCAIAQHGEWALDCAEVRRFKSLKELSLGAFVNPVCIDELKSFQDLRRLSIQQRFSDPFELNVFEKLSELSVSGDIDLILPPIGMKCLRAVSLYEGRPSYSIPSLAPNIDYLRLQSVRQSELRSLLREESQLRVLKLYDIKKLEDLSFLSSCRSITHLTLDRCRDLVSLDGLNQCSGLLELELRECKSLEDVSSIRQFFRLSGLFVVNCAKLSPRDFSELEVSREYFYPN